MVSRRHEPEPGASTTSQSGIREVDGAADGAGDSQAQYHTWEEGREAGNGRIRQGGGPRATEIPEALRVGPRVGVVGSTNPYLDGRVAGNSAAPAPTGVVDPWSHGDEKKVPDSSGASTSGLQKGTACFLELTLDAGVVTGLC